MHPLANLFKSRLSARIKHSSATTCSRWAEKYRVMGNPFPGPYSFAHHPWAREMHDSEAPENVGQKAAQMGYSETTINRALFSLDVLKLNVLYILPSQTPDAKDFSVTRFDPALESSEHIRNMFSDTKNVGVKRTGCNSLFIRGSRGRSALKAIDTAVIIYDEFDEMAIDKVTLAEERQSGQHSSDCSQYKISTPHIDGKGVNREFLLSSQEEFFFVCPSCSRLTELVFPECLKITAEDETDPKVQNSYLICKECKATLPHEAKIEFLQTGRWVPAYTDRIVRGFHINQLYSPTITPARLAVAYLKSLKDVAHEQEFWNSKLGLPHVVANARVTDADLAECRGSFKMGIGRGHFITMGVDVGSWLHVVVKAFDITDDHTIDPNMDSNARILFATKVKEFGELQNLLEEYDPDFAVIDAQPEKRKSFEFCNNNHGRVKMCYYNYTDAGRQLIEHAEREYSVTADRTAWLDCTLSRYQTRRIKLPVDIPMEFLDQIKAPARIYEKDRNDQTVARYHEGTDQDHYAHADNYAEIALQLAVSQGVALDAPNVLG